MESLFTCQLALPPGRPIPEYRKQLIKGLSGANNILVKGCVYNALNIGESDLEIVEKVRCLLNDIQATINELSLM